MSLSRFANRMSLYSVLSWYSIKRGRLQRKLVDKKYAKRKGSLVDSSADRPVVLPRFLVQSTRRPSCRRSASILYRALILNQNDRDKALDWCFMGAKAAWFNGCFHKQ
uniref:rRNA-processing protein fcf2 n=1 Tax=Rhizophora mucronata TaxID=61149 RepID=A0A2P2LYV0_RHIMU